MGLEKLLDSSRGKPHRRGTFFSWQNNDVTAMRRVYRFRQKFRGGVRQGLTFFDKMANVLRRATKYIFIVMYVRAELTIRVTEPLRI